MLNEVEGWKKHWSAHPWGRTSAITKATLIPCCQGACSFHTWNLYDDKPTLKWCEKLASNSPTRSIGSVLGLSGTRLLGRIRNIAIIFSLRVPIHACPSKLVHSYDKKRIHACSWSICVCWSIPCHSTVVWGVPLCCVYLATKLLSHVSQYGGSGRGKQNALSLLRWAISDWIPFQASAPCCRVIVWDARLSRADRHTKNIS